MTRTPTRTSSVVKTPRVQRKVIVTNSESDEDVFVKPLITPSSPRKNRRIPFDEPVTPPKLQRKCNGENTPGTPSTLLNKLSIVSPDKNGTNFTPKKLFQNQYQSARRSLHSSVPVKMPGREEEIRELSDFINNCLKNKKSGTLYISGPPGTGKTAALSVILQQQEIFSKTRQVFVNCTTIKSAKAIFARVASDLSLTVNGKTEKDYLASIEKCLTTSKKMIILALDEIDQLDSKKQSVLYTVFEWPALVNSKLILIGIANALDLTDRILPRLQARCELKPQLMHFTPYSKQQIVSILSQRLQESNSSSIFTKPALELLAGKVAAVSGDIRRALDIGRRVIELTEQYGTAGVLKSMENLEETQLQTVNLTDVLKVLNSVYGTSHNFNEEDDDTFPLQQKIVVCTLVLILRKARNKDITIGRLHEVYKKICKKRNILAVDQAEFVGLCSLIESKGIVRVTGKKEARLHKVSLEWDEEEVTRALKDKQLMSSILQDCDCLGKL